MAKKLGVAGECILPAPMPGRGAGERTGASTKRSAAMRIGKALIGPLSALGPTRRDGVLAVWFSRVEVVEVDLHADAVRRSQVLPMCLNT